MKSEPHNSDFPRATVARLVADRLRSRLSSEDSSGAAAEHIDADSMAAFVEGRLEDAEARPLISHLVNCGSCLHFTAELIRYEAEADEISSATVSDESASPLRRFFERFAGGALPQFSEDTVFAYNDNGDEEKTEPEEPNQK